MEMNYYDNDASDKEEKKPHDIAKILVGIDGSEESLRAADFALSIAKKYNGEVIALSVFHEPSFADLSMPTEIEQWKRFRSPDAEHGKWADKVKEMAISKNVRLSVERVESPLPTGGVIVDYAEKEQADLIVVGTRGRTGFSKLLLGSVAQTVAMYSTKPVLIMK